MLAPFDATGRDGTLACVLLGERHHTLSEGVRGLLETAFDAVFMVADEASLLEGAARLQPALVVVDLGLAGGDLPRLAARLRECAPSARLLLLSVHDECTIASDALDAGADGLVVKSQIATELLPAVDAILAGRRFFSTAAYPQ
ncbi:MAG: response regulator transcription factor [Burkholderiales bacterium]